MKLPEAHSAARQAWVTRWEPLIPMRVTKENRVPLSNKTPRKRIAAGRTVRDKERARIDLDIDDTLKEHFADKRALLKECKGIGPGTPGGLMAMLPELGQLPPTRKSANSSASPRSMATVGDTRADVSPGADEPMGEHHANHGNPECDAFQFSHQTILRTTARQGNTQKGRPRRLYAQTSHPF